MSRSRLLHPTRRSLLGGLCGSALLGGLGLRRAGALANALTNDADRYFVFCYFGGGWDALLGLDPRDPDVFRPELRGDTLIERNYDALIEDGIADQPLSSSVPGMNFGPYIGSLIDWAPQMALVRGMSMDTLSHSAGRRRFITGKQPAGLQARGSAGATHLAAWLGENEPVPNLVSGVESYNVDQPVYASGLEVADVDDLLDILAPGRRALPPEVMARIGVVLDEFGDCETTKASRMLTEALEQRLAARRLVDAGLDALFDFRSNDPDMVALRQQYGFASNQLNTPRARAAMASTALTAGISRTVSIQVAGQLDTHDNWARDHGPILREGFDVVSTLAADLASRPYGDQGESWLDRTVIVGFSEFTRTPLMNVRGGRDHALMNSCFLIGGGVQGGRIIGASSDVGMAPQSVNLQTGAVDPAGEIIRPEHIYRALLGHVGVTDDVADLRVDPLTALFS